MDEAVATGHQVHERAEGRRLHHGALVGLPTRTGRGLAISSIMRAASSVPSASREPMNTVPSSSMLMSAPVIAMISLIILPFGPITSPILSTGIWIVMIRGAFELTSSRGAGERG